MTVNVCETCGQPFAVTEGEDWKRLCLSCWKASKRAETRAAAWTPADTRLIRLATENDALTAEVERLRAALAEAQRA